jgi:hypothetical protein
MYTKDRVDDAYSGNMLGANDVHKSKLNRELISLLGHIFEERERLAV